MRSFFFDIFLRSIHGTTLWHGYCKNQHGIFLLTETSQYVM